MCSLATVKLTKAATQRRSANCLIYGHDVGADDNADVLLLLMVLMMMMMLMMMIVMMMIMMALMVMTMYNDAL